MCPWKSSRTSSARSTCALGTLVPLCFLLVALCLAVPVTAEPAVRVTAEAYDYVFSESLSFSLQAVSAQPVAEVILFYGREGQRLVRRIYPTFAPGAELSVSHVEELERGQYAPGTQFRVWWRLYLVDGTLFETEATKLDYTDTNQDWQMLTGSRVDLHWYGQERQNAERLLQTAQEALVRLEQEIGVQVEHRVDVYAYNSASDMRVATSERGAGYDERITTLGVAVDEDTLLILGTHRDAEPTLAHELSHIVVGLATENPFADLPRWLDEGLAMYAEGKLPPDNQEALERAVRRDTLLSVRSMTSYTGQAELVDLFYGEAYSIVDFMLDAYGRERMSELLAVFAEGARQEDALRQIYDLDLDTLDAAWRKSLGLEPRGSSAIQGSSAPDPRPLEREAVLGGASSLRALPWYRLPLRVPAVA